MNSHAGEKKDNTENFPNSVSFSDSNPSNPWVHFNSYLEWRWHIMGINLDCYWIIIMSTTLTNRFYFIQYIN